MVLVNHEPPLTFPHLQDVHRLCRRVCWKSFGCGVGDHSFIIPILPDKSTTRTLLAATNHAEIVTLPICKSPHVLICYHHFVHAALPVLAPAELSDPNA